MSEDHSTTPSRAAPAHTERVRIIPCAPSARSPSANVAIHWFAHILPYAAAGGRVPVLLPLVGKMYGDMECISSSSSLRRQNIWETSSRTFL